MTPAEVVIDTFGGIRATARALDIAPSTVLRWSLPRKRGGRCGMVPQVYVSRLLEAARGIGKVLTAEHLENGKPGIERRIIRRF